MITYSVLIKHLRFPGGERGEVFVTPHSDAVPCDRVGAVQTWAGSGAEHRLFGSALVF